MPIEEDTSLFTHERQIIHGDAGSCMYQEKTVIGSRKSGKYQVLAVKRKTDNKWDIVTQVVMIEKEPKIILLNKDILNAENIIMTSCMKRK